RLEAKGPYSFKDTEEGNLGEILAIFGGTARSFEVGVELRIGEIEDLPRRFALDLPRVSNLLLGLANQEIQLRVAPPGHRRSLRRLARSSEKILAQAPEGGAELPFEGGLPLRGQEGVGEGSEREAGELPGAVAEGLGEPQVLAGQVGAEEGRIVGV